DAVVIGAGATGLFTALDLSLRGAKVVVIDRGGILNGTSGRMHGLLHSGARYVTNDQVSAKECISENIILSRIAHHSIFDTGGLFVSLKDDDSFVETFVKGLRDAKIPYSEVDVKRALELEPNLNKEITHSISVPDKVVDPFKLFSGVAYLARQNGVKFLLYDRVIGISGSKVMTEKGDVNAKVVVNAAGPWASKVSAMHSKESEVIEEMSTIGAMLVFDRKLNSMVINRMRPPSDGDIVVPYYERSILGTTAQVVEDPDNVKVEDEDVQYIIEEGSAMLPKLSGLKPTRYYYSVRPLLKGTGARSASRDYRIFDEGDMVTIIGGKLTTSRLMAETVVDKVSEKLGIESKCSTAVMEIPDAISLYSLSNTIGDEIYGPGYSLFRIEEYLQNDTA
ncbi:MAG: FAD-dependent oxidoreductase, partial [Conexivisphaerales archaeon]